VAPDGRGARAGWAVLLALAALPVLAAEPAARPGDTLAPLDLSVNGGPAQTVLVLIRERDVLVSPDDLVRAGLRGFDGPREVVAGRELVSLRSLRPPIGFVLDERALTLRLTAGPELLGRAAIDLLPSPRPPGLVPSAEPSAFLDYSARLATRGRFSGVVEGGASRGDKLLYASGQLYEDGRAGRGLTSLTVDDVPALRRVAVGDAFATSSTLGGGVLLGGVSIAREFGLDPYLVRSPLPRISGFASTPSTLDVYVNGVLTREVPLPPGGYDVSNLPVTTGSANVQTVLKDAYGRTQQLDWRAYYSSGLLARGLSDYGYALGFRRVGYGLESDHYDRPILVGRHRLGLTDTVTGGARLDAAPDLVSGGPSLSVALPFGTVDLEAAASREGERAGAAGALSYGWISPRLGAGALVRILSASYANAALRAADDRALVQANVYAGAPVLPRLAASASYAVQDFRDAGLYEALSVRADLSLPGNLTLSVTGERTRAASAPAVLGAMLSLAWAAAPALTADLSGQGGGAGKGISLGVQKGLPAGTGVGFWARAADGPGPRSADALFQGQWDSGRCELQYDRLGSSETASATLSGAVVAIGQRTFLTRPVQDGFGVIRTGVPGVRGYAEGQEIGRTDARGDLFVPSLIPYYGNRLSIADRDVPLDFRIGPVEQVVAPRVRGGAVARFPLERIRTLAGTLHLEPGDGVPAFGELALPGLGLEGVSPIGGDGRFYLENVPPGGHLAIVVWSGGRCLARLVVPEDSANVELGRVACVVEGDAVRAPASGGEPPAPPQQ